MPPAAAADPHQQANDASCRYFPCQPHNRDYALQNAWAPPGAPANLNGQPEVHREDIPPPITGRGTAGPGIAQDLHHVDVAYQGIMNPGPAYIFPDVGHVQGVPVQGQWDAPENQEQHALVGYFPPGPPQDALPHPLIPIPNQPRAENLRRLAHLHLDRPGAQVRMVCTEEGTAGGFKVVIILETPNVP
ncbi:hypothetical protein F5888DRAFT_1296516 [Russula emetica]|nr:hypothetical protein F5888DRAFT_1296516 [Russula emetica]